jgi:hypothetical protein
MTENEAQISVIKYFLGAFKNSAPMIIIELPFCEYTRRADVVFVIEGQTHAVEIKTERDKLSTVEAQIDDYSKVFDFNYIAAEGKNYFGITKLSSRNIGILEINGMAKRRRPAKQIKRLNKAAVLSTIDFAFLRKHEKTVYKGTKQDTITATARKMTISECRELLNDFLYCRYKSRCDLFYKEVGETIHTDDLLTLTRPLTELSICL